MFSTTFFIRVKVTVVFVCYHVCDAYITMLFTYIYQGCVFQQKKISGQKLPRCLYLNYQDQCRKQSEAQSGTTHSRSAWISLPCAATCTITTSNQSTDRSSKLAGDTHAAEDVRGRWQKEQRAHRVIQKQTARDAFDFVSKIKWFTK